MIQEVNRNKAKTIEIIGPPGIGKSTLYEEVCKTWSLKKNWIYYDMLLAPKRPPISNFLQWLEHNYRRYTGKRLSKSLPMDFGLRFIRENRELASFCWKYLTENPNHNSMESCFRHAYFLYDDFSTYQAIADKRHPKPCLIEEGFFQKSFLIHDDKQVMEDILDEYLAVLPLPHAVIELDTDNVDLIIQRLKTRKKTIPSHYNKVDKELVWETKKWQHLNRLVYDKLQAKNVLVYRMDGGKPLDEKVALLESTLASIKA